MTTNNNSLDRWAEDFMTGRIDRRTFIKRMAAVGLTFSSISGILAACTSTPAASPSAAAGTTAPGSAAGASGAAASGTTGLKKLGFSHPFPGSDIYRPLRKGLREEAAKFGVETLESTADGDAGKQLAELNTWIQTVGVQAVSILNINGEGLKPTVDQAHAKNVKVIGYANHIEGEDGYNVFDNAQGASEVAKLAIEWINKNIPEGEIEMGLLTLDTIEVGKVRVHNAEQEIIKAVPRVKVVASAEGTNLAGPAQEATRSMFQAHPDIRVLICISDDGQLGAYQALKALGKQKDVWSAGYDGAKPVMELIRDKELVGVTAAIPLKDIGAANVWVAANLIDNKDPKFFDAPYKLVTNDTPDVANQLIADFE
jgi:ribose transport system substrate-binding protein